MKDCVFCKIVIGEMPAEKIWEDDNHLAILDIFPNTLAFTVVLTKKHLPSYVFENDDEVVSNLTLATKKVALLLGDVFDDVGRVGMFYEGFGVDHLHSKLFPMHGTGNMKKWKAIESKDMNDGPGPYYEKYPGFLSSRSSDMVNLKKLHETAEKIKSKLKK